MNAATVTRESEKRTARSYFSFKSFCVKNRERREREREKSKRKGMALSETHRHQVLKTMHVLFKVWISRLLHFPGEGRKISVLTRPRGGGGGRASAWIGGRGPGQWRAPMWHTYGISIRTMATKEGTTIVVQGKSFQRSSAADKYWTDYRQALCAEKSCASQYSNRIRGGWWGREGGIGCQATRKTKNETEAYLFVEASHMEKRLMCLCFIELAQARRPSPLFLFPEKLSWPHGDENSTGPN